MPKAYWIARNDIKDAETYKVYQGELAKAFGKFGAKYVVRGGRFETVEGQSRGRNLVIEFKDYETALACYHSPEYAHAKDLRIKAATCDIIIIEGHDGEQPFVGA